MEISEILNIYDDNNVVFVKEQTACVHLLKYNVCLRSFIKICLFQNFDLLGSFIYIR